MNTNGRMFIKVAAICLIALVLVSAAWSLVSSLGLVRGAGGFLTAGRLPGAFTGRNFNRGNGTGTFQPPQGAPQGQPDFRQPNNGTQQGQQNFQGNFPQRSGLFRLLGVLRWVGTGVSIAALIAGVFAVIGLFKQKKWGRTLAFILAAVLALTSVIGLFRLAISLTTGVAMLKIILAAAVIVLLALPASRKTFATVAAAGSSPDEEDDLSYRTIR